MEEKGERRESIDNIYISLYIHVKMKACLLVVDKSLRLVYCCNLELFIAKY